MESAQHLLFLFLSVFEIFYPLPLLLLLPFYLLPPLLLQLLLPSDGGLRQAPEQVYLVLSLV